MNKTNYAKTHLPWSIALALATALGSSMSMQSSSYAQAPTSLIAQANSAHTFKISAQLLSDALVAFGQQTKMQISAHGDVTRNLLTKGVVGNLSTEMALRQLLSGTGLLYELSAQGILLSSSRSGDANDTNVLSPIRVEARRSSDDHANAADRAHSIDVTRESLQRRNPKTVKQVFAGESNISVGGGIPLTQKIYVNAVEETNLAVSIDGARQNNKAFHHIGSNIIDPSLLKAVRVDPGVAPADAGPGAMAGAIVYETVDVDDVLEPGRTQGGFVTASFDTDTGTVQNGASAYGRLNGFELLGFFKWGKGDDYVGGNGQQVFGSGTDIRTSLGKAAYETDDGHRYEISMERVRDRADRPYRANIKNLTNRNDPTERKYDLTRQNIAFNYNQKNAKGIFDPKVTIGFGESEISVPVPFGSVGISSSLSAKVENDFNFDENNTLTIGVDVYHDVAEYDDPTSNAPTEKVLNGGLYTQGRIQPMEALDLSVGGRMDHQIFEGIDNTEISNAGLSGNASAAYRLHDTTTLRAGYSNVWGGVSLAESFIFNSAWDYSGGIKPVRSENITLGIEVRHDAMTFDAGVFRSNFKNARKATFRGGPSLTADFKTRGFNLGSKYEWATGFARLSYTESQIRVNGALSDSDTSSYLGAPLGRVIALEVETRYDRLGLKFGGTLDAALKNSDTEVAGGAALAAYERVSLHAQYQPADLDFLTLRLEANNLFDETYADRATYGQDFSNVDPMYEPGRSFLLMAKAKF